MGNAVCCFLLEKTTSQKSKHDLYQTNWDFVIDGNQKLIQVPTMHKKKKKVITKSCSRSYLDLKEAYISDISIKEF